MSLPSPSEEGPDFVKPKSPVNMRSLGVGLIGVVIINSLKAFNDYTLNNTFLIRNNLPIGLIFCIRSHVVDQWSVVPIRVALCAGHG